MTVINPLDWKLANRTFVQCLICNMHVLKSRFFKNSIDLISVPQNSNLGRESSVQKSGVPIPVGEGQIFCHFSFFFFTISFLYH